MRSLDVFIGMRRVGQLQEGDDLWRFSYDSDWAQAADSFDLSPGLPRRHVDHLDGATQRPVQWFFDNLLPEELLRQSVCREAGIRGEDAFALLQYLGAESAGALTLVPPAQALPDTGSMRSLSHAQLSERIAQLPRVTLTAGAPKRMSVAGAQHKLLVVFQKGALYEPEGATPSTHILKPDHPDGSSYPASVVNEYLTMRLARAVGLSVPDVHMLFVPEPAYVIERFDRTPLGSDNPQTGGLPVAQRKHVVDACQLLNKSRTFKHAGASVEALVNLVEATTNKASTRLQLFRWLVFNIAVANDDCHLKNLSFFMSQDGVQLAPHYDLLATGAYCTRAFANERATWPDVRMAIPLSSVQFFSDVSPRVVLEAGQQLGIPDTVARRILMEVVTRLPDAFAKEADAIRKMHVQVLANLPDAAVFVGGQERLLRVYETIVLREMLGRLWG